MHHTTANINCTASTSTTNLDAFAIDAAIITNAAISYYNLHRAQVFATNSASLSPQRV
jgi:hypothetical protein